MRIYADRREGTGCQSSQGEVGVEYSWVKGEYLQGKPTVLTREGVGVVLEQLLGVARLGDEPGERALDVSLLRRRLLPDDAVLRHRPLVRLQHNSFCLSVAVYPAVSHSCLTSVSHANFVRAHSPWCECRCAGRGMAAGDPVCGTGVAWTRPCVEYEGCSGSRCVPLEENTNIHGGQKPLFLTSILQC